MFYAPMGRFQLQLKLELPLFSSFTIVHSNSCVCSCRPFVVLTTSSTLNKTCQRYCKYDERLIGTNTTIWMGWRWNLKIEIIPILIPTTNNSLSDNSKVAIGLSQDTSQVLICRTEDVPGQVVVPPSVWLQVPVCEICWRLDSQHKPLRRNRQQTHRHLPS